MNSDTVIYITVTIYINYIMIALISTVFMNAAIPIAAVLAVRILFVVVIYVYIYIVCCIPNRSQATMETLLRDAAIAP